MIYFFIYRVNLDANVLETESVTIFTCIATIFCYILYLDLNPHSIVFFFCSFISYIIVFLFSLYLFGFASSSLFLKV